MNFNKTKLISQIYDQLSLINSKTYLRYSSYLFNENNHNNNFISDLHAHFSNYGTYLRELTSSEQDLNFADWLGKCDGYFINNVSISQDTRQLNEFMAFTNSIGDINMEIPNTMTIMKHFSNICDRTSVNIVWQQVFGKQYKGGIMKEIHHKLNDYNLALDFKPPYTETRNFAEYLTSNSISNLIQNHRDDKEAIDEFMEFLRMCIIS